MPFKNRKRDHKVTLEVEIKSWETAFLLLESNELNIKRDALTYILNQDIQESESSTELSKKLPTLLNLFEKSDKTIKNLLLKVIEKFISFLNIGIVVEYVQRLLEVCINCFISNVSDLLMTSLRILLKLLAFPLVIKQIGKGEVFGILLNMLKDYENDIKLLVLQIFKAISKDFEVIAQEVENIIPSIVEHVFCNLSEIQAAALKCLVPLMTFDPSKNLLLKSDFLFRLITLLEKTKALNIIEDLLKVIAISLGNPVALAVSNIPTLISWISTYVIEQDDERSVIGKSSVKTSQIKSIRKMPKSKQGDVSARKDEVDWTNIQICSCEILQRLAQSDAHLAAFITIGVDKKVMDLLSKSQDVNVQIAAAKAMATFLRNETVRLSVTASGGLSEFVRMYNSENPESQEAALLALDNLIKDNTIACKELGQTPHFTSKLIESVKGSEGRALLTLNIIQEFAKDEALRSKLYEFDVISKIIELSPSPSERVQAKVLHLIPLLITSTDEIALFQQIGGIEILFTHLKSTCFEVRQAATISIGLLAENESAAEILYKRGFLEHLYLMQRLGDKCLRYVDIAIKHILDANLVLKFAMTGSLDYSDITGDVFYDVGPMKASERLKSLQNYANEPLNNAIPIWLLNITEVGTLDSDGFQLPYDAELRTLLNSSTAKIDETLNFKEKIRIVAVEVVDYFGGPMTREEAYSSIDWQEITKYRCHFNTNIVPLGLPERAGYRHRALLFKFVADKVGIACKCICGEYQIAYNIIYSQTEIADKSAFVVNLMENPGEIYPADSKEANDYYRI